MTQDRASAHSKNEDHALTAASYGAFSDALGVLYIKRNRSGRLQFSQDWPAAAAYIFGPALIALDKDGTNEPEAYNALEDEAEIRRIQTVEITDNLIENSVKDGTLQKDYVAQVIRDLGRDVAALLYSETILERMPPESRDQTPES